MSGTSTNFEDWKLRSHIEIWELASIILGFDPRALGDVVVNEYGDPLDLSFEIDALVSAIDTGDLDSLPGQVRPNKNTKVTLTSAIDWLHAKGHKGIARRLSSTVHPADAPISKKGDIVERLGGLWTTIENDFKRAQENGLFEEAAAPKSGYWYEGAVIAWGKTHGKFRDPSADGAATLTAAWNGGITKA